MMDFRSLFVVVNGRRETLTRESWGNIYAFGKSLERIFTAIPSLIMVSNLVVSSYFLSFLFLQLTINISPFGMEFSL